MKKVLLLLIFAGIAGYVFYTISSQEDADPREVIENSLREIKNERSKRNKVLTPEQEAATRVQLAILEYQADRSEPPGSLDELIPVYFDSIPKNPATGEPFEYKVENGDWLLGSEVRLAELRTGGESGSSDEEETYSILASLELDDGEQLIMPSMIAEDTFVYDPTGLRDPFTPFNLAPQNDREGITELERYNLGQLKLTVVLEDNDGNLFAMVENSEGIGFKVTQGTKIGNKNGEVVEIQQDRLKILEQHTTFTGEEKTEVKELKLIR